MRMSRSVHSTNSSPVPFTTADHCIQIRDTIDSLEQSILQGYFRDAPEDLALPSQDPFAPATLQSLEQEAISSSMPCLLTPTRPRPQSPSPSHRELRPNTVWGHYLRMVGGHLPNPLYHHPSPRKTTKKPLRYRLTPAERRDLDELALEALPRPGRMLTRQLLGKIMGRSKFPSGST